MTLLLLTIRDAVLVLARGLRLGAWMRTIRRSSLLLDFVSVVATLQFLNELLEAPSESCKIRDFRAASEDDGQPASSYCLAIGGASGDILSDILSIVLGRK